MTWWRSAVADTRYILASRSPRRIELLASIGIECEVRPADIDETPLADEVPFEYVLRLANEKAQTVAGNLRADEIVIGADTTIDLDGEIIGQPNDRAHAAEILRRLSGRSHLVHTGVCILYGNTGHNYSQVVSTEVTFHPLTVGDIEAYLASGEWEGKAGAYAIQGEGRSLVATTTGSIPNVIGLPVDHLTEALVPNPS